MVHRSILGMPSGSLARPALLPSARAPGSNLGGGADFPVATSYPLEH
jgi:hypothetical protein